MPSCVGLQWMNDQPRNLESFYCFIVLFNEILSNSVIAYPYFYWVTGEQFIGDMKKRYFRLENFSFSFCLVLLTVPKLQPKASAEDRVVLTLALPKPPFPESLPNTWFLRYWKKNKQFGQACSFLLPYKQVRKRLPWPLLPLCQ